MHRADWKERVSGLNLSKLPESYVVAIFQILLLLFCYRFYKSESLMLISVVALVLVFLYFYQIFYGRSSTFIAAAFIFLTLFNLSISIKRNIEIAEVSVEKFQSSQDKVLVRGRVVDINGSRLKVENKEQRIEVSFDRTHKIAYQIALLLDEAQIKRVENSADLLKLTEDYGIKRLLEDIKTFERVRKLSYVEVVVQPARARAGSGGLKLYCRKIKTPADRISSNKYSSFSSKIYSTISKSKYFAEKSISENTQEKTFKLVSGILFGEKKYVDDFMSSTIYKIGVGHILTVSGIHVGIIFTFINFFLEKIIKAERKLSSYISFIAALFYTAISGFSPSAIRATLMLLVYMVAQILYRAVTLADVLATTLVLTLAVNPQIITELSFQLSVAAVGGIAYIYPFLYKKICRIMKITPEERSENFLFRVLAVIAKGTSVVLSAQLAVLPFQLFVFKCLPLTGTLSNLFIPELAFIILVISLLLILFSFANLSLLQTICGRILDFTVWILAHLSDIFSKLPLAYLDLNNLTQTLRIQTLSVLFFFSSLIVLQLALKSRNYPFRIFYLTIAFIAVFLSIQPFYWFSILLVPDAFDGASVIYSTGSSQAVLDFGPPEFSVYQTLRAYRFYIPDKLFLSHYHLDHIGGLFRFLNSIQDLRKIEIVVPEPKNSREQFYFLVLKNLSEDTGLKLCSLPYCKKYEYRLNNRFSILITTPDEDAIFSSDTNERNLIFEVIKKNIRGVNNRVVFYPGDADAEAIEQFKGSGYMIVISPHHGSLTGFLPDFYKDFRGTVVVPCGKNSHGLPSPEYIDFLKKGNFKFFITGQSGAFLSII